MQEEIEKKTVVLIINTAKLTAGGLKKACRLYLEARKKRSDPANYHGKQSMKHLLGKNQEVANIDISESSVRDFDRVARKYGIDYAVKKDKSLDPPRYMVFFKARDAEAMTAAFEEYSRDITKKKERPSVIEKLRSIRPLETILGKDKVHQKKKELEL